MRNKILNAIKNYCLIEKGDTVTVAISGGADSVCLLYALLSLKEELGITVNAAHLNHSIRGDEADRDQEFVQSFCEKIGVTLFCEKQDVPLYAKQNGIGLELAAREVRYEFLNRVSEGKIATAHTASDNLETMIFNLARGTTIKGLCGIPVKRDNIIRPLILCTRDEVEDYCNQNDLSFVTDSTNLSDDYSRNKIRHNVIPVLKEINSAVEEAAVRTSESLFSDNLVLENISKEILFKYCDEFALNTYEFKNISPAIAKRVIKDYFEMVFEGVLLENRHINQIYRLCINGNGKINLPSNLFAIIENNTLVFKDSTQEKEKNNFSVKISEIENVNSLFANNEIDYDKIIGKWVLRNRIEGDKIRLQNRGITKSLKKLFTENKVPENIRATIPVIADDNGLIWVYGFGVAERVAPKSNTKKILKVEVQKI